MASKRKWPPGIFKRKVCWKCSERNVEVKGDGRNKKTGYKCVHDSECPDSKKYEPDYWIRFRDRGKYVIEPAGPKLSQAKKALEARKGEIAQGRFDLARTKPRIEFRKFIEKHYLPYAKNNKKSWDRDARSLKHLVEYFGDMPLSKITGFTVENYKNKRKDDFGERTNRPISESTINRELTCLRFAFNMGIKWEMLDVNPVKGVKFFKEKKRERFLSMKEITQLLHACSPEGGGSGQLYTMVLMAIHTGMRKREVLGLTWQEVDFKKSVIRLPGERTKNGEPRAVKINSVLLEELRNHRKFTTGDYVFTGYKGKPIDDVRGRLNKAFKRACIEDATFHTFRHTWASHQVMNGTDLLTLQKMGGWKSLKMVQRYAHLSDEHEQEAAERFGNAIKIYSGYSETAKATA